MSQHNFPTSAYTLSLPRTRTVLLNFGEGQAMYSPSLDSPTRTSNNTAGVALASTPTTSRHGKDVCGLALPVIGDVGQ